MDLVSVLKLLPTIIGAISSVRSIIDAAKSNEDIVNKIAALSPAVSELIGKYGAMFFPGVATQLQSTAAAISIFGQEFVKQAQSTLNIISPILGLPAPNLVVDGLSGPRTQAATKAVQEKLKTMNWKDLVADGFFGFKTRDAIAAFIAGLSSSAAPTPLASS